MNNRKIYWYSLFSSGYLLIHSEARADAVYTDVVPDSILDIAGEFAYFDMDANGIIDFTFHNADFTIYDFPYGNVRFQRVAALLADGNMIAGSFQSTLYSSRYYYPFALDVGDVINSDLEFQNYWYQGLATRIYDPNIFSTATATFTHGNWYPEALDKYLGVGFVDAAGHIHYGWIRCDVRDEGRTLIIKDFAYETKVGEGIVAGDTVGDTTFSKVPTIKLDTLVNVSIPESLGCVEVYSFNKTIYINQPEFGLPLTCNIFDVNGNLCLSKQTFPGNTTVTLSEFPPGNYLIEISTADSKMTKMLYIN